MSRLSNSSNHKHQFNNHLEDSTIKRMTDGGNPNTHVNMSTLADQLDQLDQPRARAYTVCIYADSSERQYASLHLTCVLCERQCASLHQRLAHCWLTVTIHSYRNDIRDSLSLVWLAPLPVPSSLLRLSPPHRLGGLNCPSVVAPVAVLYYITITFGVPPVSILDCYSCSNTTFFYFYYV